MILGRIDELDWPSFTASGQLTLRLKGQAVGLIREATLLPQIGGCGQGSELLKVHKYRRAEPVATSCYGHLTPLCVLVSGRSPVTPNETADNIS